MTRLINYLFPPPAPPSMGLSAEVREAQQLHSSSLRRIAVMAKKDETTAKVTGGIVRQRVQEKEAAYEAVESALALLKKDES